MGVEPEMPEAAIIFGENRIDGGVIYLQNFLAGITPIESGDSRAEGVGYGRAIALENDLQAVTHRTSEL
jgi:hypothetical protein